jgi:hypothetical protein
MTIGLNGVPIGQIKPRASVVGLKFAISFAAISEANFKSKTTLETLAC